MTRQEFDKLVEEKIKEFTEGAGMSINDIQKKTAFNWAAMAVAITKIGKRRNVPITDIFTILYDEAIEHGALVEDDFKTARLAKEYMK